MCRDCLRRFARASSNTADHLFQLDTSFSEHVRRAERTISDHSVIVFDVVVNIDFRASASPPSRLPDP
jgi:hypothetical protein